MGTHVKLIEELLFSDVKKATGCTEPVTIALATFFALKHFYASDKVQENGEELEALIVRPSINLFKNAMEVGIPGTQYAHGIPLASALGALLARSSHFHKKIHPDLNLLSHMNKEILEEAQRFISSNKMKIEVDYSSYGLSIEALASGNQGTKIKAIIKDSHDYLFLLEKNGRSILEDEDFYKERLNKKKGSSSEEEQGNFLIDLRKKVASIPYKEVVRSLPYLSEKCREHMMAGPTLNLIIAESGLSKDLGILNIGSRYEKLLEEKALEDNFINKACMLTASAVDARMSGCDLAVMTSAGSGNQGLTLTIPIMTFAHCHKELKNNEKLISEALALAHLTTSITKAHTGSLSAMCGCVVGAGMGVSAALTYLFYHLDHNLKEQEILEEKNFSELMEKLGFAIDVMVASVTGIICDGAKVGCAVKSVCGLNSAWTATLLARKNIKIPESNGVLGNSIDLSLQNIGKIAVPGMLATDNEILSIMVNR